MVSPFLSVVTALAGYQFIQHDEHALYAGLSHVLGEAGFLFEREHRLDGKSRVDFYLPSPRLVIEVKVQGSPAAVLRQLTRYASHPTVDAILLITTLAKLARIPDSIGGKPAGAFRIAGGFG